MMKNTFNAMLKNRPKENDEQNAIDFILAEYKDISDGIVIDGQLPRFPHINPESGSPVFPTVSY